MILDSDSESHSHSYSESQSGARQVKNPNPDSSDSSLDGLDSEKGFRVRSGKKTFYADRRWIRDILRRD